MTSRLIIVASVAFALGALVMGDGIRRHAPACEPVPADEPQRPVREPALLSSPLACERGWARSCIDFGACKAACI